VSSVSKLSKAQARDELWRRGVLVWLLDKNQKELYNLFYNSSHKVQTWLLARRCLAEGTLIKTPTGLVEIQKLKPGDIVFGYNKDGSVTPTSVKEVINTGVQEVVDLTSHGRVFETCSKNHTWLVTNDHFKYNFERSVENFRTYDKIVRKWITPSFTGKHYSKAYTLGALLGDGCSRQNFEEGSRQIFISSEDDKIPSKCAKQLKCNLFKNGGVNYTWCLTNKKEKVLGKRARSKSRLRFKYYDLWCRGRYAHEKIIDLDVIRKFDSSSQKALLAGLIDTDGSVSTTKDNCLVVAFSSQSMSIMRGIQYLIHNLYQHKCEFRVDNREKYVNGPCYSISVKNNLICKRMLKSLDKWLVVPRKKWKKEYTNLLEHNTNRNYVGVIVKNPRQMQTWDISINNETNLYLTANGLVTHNSGKSYSLCVLALEQCLRQPDSIVKYVAPTKLQITQIIRPLMKKLLVTCPEDVRPEFREKDYIYYFPNGSEIQLAGTEGGHAEKLRGQDSMLDVVDEAGSCTDLDYIIKDILLPTTLTTNGKIVLAGTPPRNPDHDFVQYIEEAEFRGSLVKKDVYANPRLTKEQIDELIVELGGINTEACQRELFIKIIKDKAISVIPEFDEKLEKEIVVDWPKPPFYDTYVAMDLGFKDLTAVLFAYYDFRGCKLVIEDEIVVEGVNLTLPKLATDILKKEEDLWTNPLINEVRRPLVRVSDINYIVTAEMSRSTNNKLSFITPLKDEKMAAINNLRVMLASKKIIIHPRCKHLVMHLRSVKWSGRTTRDEFARSVDDGHYDTVDALIYMMRAVNYSRNPYPLNYSMDLKNMYFVNPEKFRSNTTQLDAYRQIFGLRKKAS